MSTPLDLDAIRERCADPFNLFGPTEVLTLISEVEALRKLTRVIQNADAMAFRERDALHAKLERAKGFLLAYQTEGYARANEKALAELEKP